MKRSEKYLVPPLRFSGYGNSWEEKTLGDFFTFKNGVNADKLSYGEGYKFINVLDIIAEDPINWNNIIGKVDIPDNDFIKNEVVYGDILFQRSSETREEVGQSNVYLDSDRSSTFGGFVIRGRPLKSINSVFFHYLLKVRSVRRDMTSRSGGSTRYNIGQESLSKVIVILPHDQKEQERIASFLSAVDKKISQLKRKKKLLDKYKKGCMQHIFSQNIRFKDDHEKYHASWDQNFLGNVVDIRTGKKDVNEGNPTGIYPFFTCAKKHTFSDSYSFDDKAILIAGNGEVGHCQKYTGKFEAYQRTYVLTAFKLSFDFTFVYLSNRFSEDIQRQKQMGAMPYIKLSSLKNYPIPEPSMVEQNKIASFLTRIDTKINLINLELMYTKTFRQGLLQKLFA